MAEVQDTQNDSESQSSPMEDPTQIPKFTRQDIKKMKDQLLTLNLGKLCLDTTGSVNEKRQRLMDLFYPKMILVLLNFTMLHLWRIYNQI